MVAVTNPALFFGAVLRAQKVLSQSRRTCSAASHA